MGHNSLRGRYSKASHIFVSLVKRGINWYTYIYILRYMPSIYICIWLKLFTPPSMKTSNLKNLLLMTNSRATDLLIKVSK